MDICNLCGCVVSSLGGKVSIPGKTFPSKPVDSINGENALSGTKYSVGMCSDCYGKFLEVFHRFTQHERERNNLPKITIGGDKKTYGYKSNIPVCLADPTIVVK